MPQKQKNVYKAYHHLMDVKTKPFKNVIILVENLKKKMYEKNVPQHIKVRYNEAASNMFNENR